MMKIRCVVERITYQNPENGYSVLKVHVKGYDDLVTVVGNLLDANVGAVLLIDGDWYYLRPDGSMATGWIIDNNRKYYLNPISNGRKGKMLVGWQLIDGKWYYFNENSDGMKGALLTDSWVGEYYVNRDGVWEESKQSQ